MKRWRSVLALSFAAVLVASAAFAQATTGSSPKDQPSAQAEKAKGAQTETSGTTGQPAGTPGPATGEAGKPDAAKGDAMKGDAMKADADKGKRAARGGNREQVRAAQQALKDKGLYDAEVDGIMGPKTREAIREFQKKENLKETGRLDAETLARLGVERTGAADTSGSPAASPRTMPGGAGKDAGTAGKDAGTKTESGSSAASPGTTPGPAKSGEKK
ncbi:MAG TPA: peptidoglycan-binding domain-containing protein [Candidatus Binatia bacterium]|nr:peptidoglycan-binding domain-containing protein [Candidatus Binatia bacterium]